MYCPHPFKEDDLAQLTELIRLNPLGILINPGSDELTADHIPLFYENNKLIGHIAKSNPLSKANLMDSVLVIFQGADSYISPNWYPTKSITHKAVPTWNYAIVHVHGHLHLITEMSQKLDILHRLTQIHEANQAVPWSINDAPTDYIEKMLDAVIGIEIIISKIQGKWKASQNQPAENKTGIIQHLQKCTDEKSAKMIEYIQERSADKA